MANKLGSINDALGEPEPDANTALTELDKSLRSGKIGEQCEAIVRFPRLFEKYPFPILINSSLLKLADVFREGNNFLRVWVLRVCQQSEKHLEKIINIDEFVRRIFSVLHSNDPVARALTLRTLGAVAGIIPEQQQVHHGIRSSLESHDDVEVEAAIIAATQFAAQSKKFAVSMCNKVSEMIEGLETPSHRKLQLIPILQHMHHDTTTANMVRSLCRKLLSGYPAEDFVLVTLSTLTQLAAATLVNIPEQVTLLVHYLRNDPRWTIKAAALEGLRRLAREGAHLWPQQAVNEVVEVAYSTDKPALLSAALGVLNVLAYSALTCHQQVNSDSPLLRLAKKCAYSANTLIAAKAIRILASITSYCYEEKMPVTDIEETLRAIDSLFLLTSCEPVRLTEVKSCLKAMVQLCRASPDLAERCVVIIAKRLFHSDSCNELLCEALGAVGGKDARALRIIILEMVEKLRKLSRQSEDDETNSETMVILCTLLFQCQLDHDWNVDVRHAVCMASSGENDWANFRIARAAARYGHHEIAFEIFGRLKKLVSSEHLHFWLSSLEELGKGEAALQGEESIIPRLSIAITHHCKALAALKAASTPSQSLQFQAEYVKIRCEFLQCLVQLVHACNTHCITPPPAIAAATYPYHSRDELQRYGQVTSQLQKSVKELKNCGEMYQKLYQSAFDADPESLTNIQMYQQICLLLANCTEKVCQLGRNEDFSLDLSSSSYGLEIKYLVERCQQTILLVEPILDNPETRPITHQHVSALIQAVQALAETAFCLPRFYFQTLQSTVIKLNISSQSRIGDTISVTGGSQLVLKVEGVIVHGLRPGLFRQAAAVVVTLQSQLQSRQHSQPDAKASEIGSTITQSITPHRDYFSSQFLLGFTTGGQYMLTVEAAISDENGHIWRTGPRTTLSAKYHEEPKPSTVPAATRSFPQQRQF